MAQGIDRVGKVAAPGRRVRRFWAVATLASVAVLAVLGGPPLVAGAATTVTVSGVVFRDFDNDGVHDAGEPGVVGIRVHRNSGAGTPSTVTGADGQYSLSGLPAGGSGYLSVETGWLRSQCAQLNCVAGPGRDNDYQTSNQFIRYPLASVTQNASDVNVGLLPDWPGDTAAAPAPQAGVVPANPVDVAARLSLANSTCSDGKYVICQPGDTYTVSAQLHNEGTTAITGLRAVLALPVGDRLTTGDPSRDVALNAPATSPGITSLTAGPVSTDSQIPLLFAGTLVPGGLARVTAKVTVGGGNGTPGCVAGHPTSSCPSAEPLGAPLMLAVTHIDQSGDPDSFGPGCNAAVDVRQCPTGIHDKQVEPDEVDPVGHNVDAAVGIPVTYNLKSRVELLSPTPTGGWSTGQPVTWRVGAYNAGPLSSASGWTLNLLLPVGSQPAAPANNAMRTCTVGSTSVGYPFVRCTGRGPLSPGVTSIAVDVHAQIPAGAAVGALAVLSYVQPAAGQAAESNALGTPPINPAVDAAGTSTDNDDSAAIDLP